MKKLFFIAVMSIIMLGNVQAQSITQTVGNGILNNLPNTKVSVTHDVVSFSIDVTDLSKISGVSEESIKSIMYAYGMQPTISALVSITANVPDIRHEFDIYKKMGYSKVIFYVDDNKYLEYIL